MLSAPHSIPALLTPVGPGTVNVPATSGHSPIRSVRTAAVSSPPCDTKFGSSKLCDTAENACDAFTEQMPLGSVRYSPSQGPIVPGQRASAVSPRRRSTTITSASRLRCQVAAPEGQGVGKRLGVAASGKSSSSAGCTACHVNKYVSATRA